MYIDLLKPLPFGKEKKKPSLKQEKPLHESLCKYHGDVYSHFKMNNKNVNIVLGKKIQIYD
jgi:hypothetical protein